MLNIDWFASRRHVFVHQSVVRGEPSEVWEFHEEPGTFQKLIPPFEPTTVIQAPDGLGSGSIVKTRTWIGPLPVRIEAEIIESRRPMYFSDRLMKGPFAEWHHRHEFLPGPTPGTTLYRDELLYRPPLGWLGELVRPYLIEPRMRKLFEFRHGVVRDEMARRAGSRV
jgi:ligand-binding SRPBCC domain-containing protein